MEDLDGWEKGHGSATAGAWEHLPSHVLTGPWVQVSPARRLRREPWADLHESPACSASAGRTPPRRSEPFPAPPEDGESGPEPGFPGPPAPQVPLPWCSPSISHWLFPLQLPKSTYCVLGPCVNKVGSCSAHTLVRGLTGRHSYTDGSKEGHSCRT